MCPTCLTDFNDMSTSLELFYAYRRENRVYENKNKIKANAKV